MHYNSNLLHPAWVTGFIDGEGTFYVGIYPKSDMAMGYQITLEFSITQHIRDKILMTKLINFFGCGYLTLDTATKLQFRIRGIQDLQNHLFPLLDAYPLQTQKSLDAQSFREVHALVVQKEHLTQQGLDKIRLIKATMNRSRMKQYK